MADLSLKYILAYFFLVSSVLGIASVLIVSESTL